MRKAVRIIGFGFITLAIIGLAGLSQHLAKICFADEAEAFVAFAFTLMAGMGLQAILFGARRTSIG